MSGSMFRCAEDALRWAFETLACPIVKISSVNAMRGGGGHGLMSSQERHAQAAMILGMVERLLSQVEIAYVKAQFGVDRSGVGEILVPWMALGLSTGIHSRRAIEDMILGYCGFERGIRALRKELGVSTAGALEVRRTAYRHLDLLHVRALSQLQSEMEARGLVDNEDYQPSYVGG